jgi:hypothetical protein
LREHDVAGYPADNACNQARGDRRDVENESSTADGTFEALDQPVEGVGFLPDRVNDVFIGAG